MFLGTQFKPHMKQASIASCIPDFILQICREVKKDAGEDNYCYSFGTTAGFLAVFDGCGGLGAQRHAYYSNKTEAYMSSRFISGAFFDNFKHLFPYVCKCDCAAEKFARTSALYCAQVLSTFRAPVSSTMPEIKGSMVRTLPTTAAAVLIQQNAAGSYVLNPIWAGDSRSYVLLPEGLAQLTFDDTTVPDPMENLYEDGILKNVICEGKTPRLHLSEITVSAPFLVLSATDGCFSYLSTPMEFEGALLETLLISHSIAEWEAMLTERLTDVAGDDVTLCMVGYGFSSFKQLQSVFVERLAELQRLYLRPLCGLPNTERDQRRDMWQSYRRQYMRYLKED